MVQEKPLQTFVWPPTSFCLSVFFIVSFVSFLGPPTVVPHVCTCVYVCSSHVCACVCVSSLWWIRQKQNLSSDKSKLMSFLSTWSDVTFLDIGKRGYGHQILGGKTWTPLWRLVSQQHDIFQVRIVSENPGHTVKGRALHLGLEARATTAN